MPVCVGDAVHDALAKPKKEDESPTLEANAMLG